MSDGAGVTAPELLVAEGPLDPLLLCANAPDAASNKAIAATGMDFLMSHLHQFDPQLVVQF
jgi:hypothetical protein